MDDSRRAKIYLKLTKADILDLLLDAESGIDGLMPPTRRRAIYAKLPKADLVDMLLHAEEYRQRRAGPGPVKLLEDVMRHQRSGVRPPDLLDIPSVYTQVPTRTDTKSTICTLPSKDRSTRKPWEYLRAGYVAPDIGYTAPDHF